MKLWKCTQLLHFQHFISRTFLGNLLLQKYLVDSFLFLSTPDKGGGEGLNPLSTICNGQTFCDLHTLLHSFHGFPGACYKVTILICLVEGRTFVCLKDSVISHLKKISTGSLSHSFFFITGRPISIRLAVAAP